MILVGHEEDGPGDGQRRGAEDRVQQKPAGAALAPGEATGAEQHDSGQRYQDVVNPQGAVQGPAQADQRPVELGRLEVAVDEEQVFVLREHTGMHHERHP